MKDNDTLENAPMEQEEILMKEQDILAGLLALDNIRETKAITRVIRIVRDGKVYVEFRVRPISEEESQECHRNATTYVRTKPGQPRIPLETDASKFRSLIIYTATVDEDRAKVWDNKRALDSMNLLQGVDMIDRLLLAGEKSRIIQEIDDISGFGLEAEDTAKNSSAQVGK